MAEFTKEEQVQAIYDLKVGYALGPADIAMLKSMARQLLVGMEHEPVAYMHHSGQVVTREECCDDKIFAICCKVETPLYAAPQLPQPVPEVTADDCPAFIKYDVTDVDEAWARGHNQCRAAMLQGAEPVSQPYTLTAACRCHTCRPVTMSDMRFVVCPECGNKRCPHANDHRNACTGSNDAGQEGSAYTEPQQ